LNDLPTIDVTGSVAFDHIMNFPGRFKDHILADKLHILNVSFLVQDLERLRGGCAANIAYACALHGLRPRLAASVGSDFDSYAEWLEANGIDLSGVVRHRDLLTASCFITTDADNNQITGFYPGAMASWQDVALSPKSSIVTISPNDPDAMRRYPQECREKGLDFLYDPGQQVIALSGDDLRDGLTGAKVVIANDYEAEMIRQKSGLDVDGVLELAEALVVTLGEKGSRIHVRGGDVIEVPAAPVERAVDPTGAGDAFRGGFVMGLVRGADWGECGRLGALTAAYCVEVQGTTAYSFDRDAFAARFEAAFDQPVAVR